MRTQFRCRGLRAPHASLPGTARGTECRRRFQRGLCPGSARSVVAAAHRPQVTGAPGVPPSPELLDRASPSHSLRSGFYTEAKPTRTAGWHHRRSLRLSQTQAVWCLSPFSLGSLCLGDPPAIFLRGPTQRMSPVLSATWRAGRMGGCQEVPASVCPSRSRPPLCLESPRVRSSPPPHTHWQPFWRDR